MGDSTGDGALYNSTSCVVREIGCVQRERSCGHIRRSVFMLVTGGTRRAARPATGFGWIFAKHSTRLALTKKGSEGVRSPQENNQKQKEMEEEHSLAAPIRAA